MSHSGRTRIRTKRCPNCGLVQDSENYTCDECGYPEHDTNEFSDNGAPQPRGESAKTNATQPVGSPNILKVDENNHSQGEPS